MAALPPRTPDAAAQAPADLPPDGARRRWVQGALGLAVPVAQVVEPGAPGDGEDPGLHRGAEAVGLARLVDLEEGRLGEVLGQPGVAAERAEEAAQPGGEAAVEPLEASRVAQRHCFDDAIGRTRFDHQAGGEPRVDVPPGHGAVAPPAPHAAPVPAPVPPPAGKPPGVQAPPGAVKPGPAPIRPAGPQPVRTRVMAVLPRDFQVVLRAQGVVRAREEVTLSAQVSGRVARA